MSAAVALLTAVIGPQANDHADRARELLVAALYAEVDPLQHVVAECGISEAEAYERAARHCGLAFYNHLRPEWVVEAPPPNWQLGLTRSLRGQIFDRDILFVAPEFSQFLRLARYGARSQTHRGRICIVPPRSLRQALSQTSAEALLSESRQRLARKWRRSSAHLELTSMARLVFFLLLLGLSAGAVAAPQAFQPALTVVLAGLLVPPALIRLAALWRYHAKSESRPPAPPLADEDLPFYTVLVPLRDEAQMVHQLATALRRLDYPASKLDIKFIVESASPTTIAAVRQHLHHMQFELVEVPAARPATKPKALNFALPLARGELAVVYDAEDIPDPQQLRQAAAMFAQHPQLACIQAELSIDNGKDSLLSSMFAAEYAGLFGILLPAFADWNAVFPLGGTSNHFRVSSLREIGGWDAFNVTEDADLGVRLARTGQQCATMRSQTMEEAPVRLGAWTRQRTRWMKGWMQTFLVHNRDISGLRRDLGWRNFAFFEVYVANLIFSPVLHTLYSAALLWRFLTGQSFLMISNGVFDIAALSMLGLGYASAMAVSLTGLQRMEPRGVGAYMVLLFMPIYWLAMGWATFRAAIELLHRPYFWAKTSHGQRRHRKSNPQHASAQPVAASDAAPARSASS